jgi:hypothetical protein
MRPPITKIKGQGENQRLQDNPLPLPPPPFFVGGDRIRAQHEQRFIINANDFFLAIKVEERKKFSLFTEAEFMNSC